jgi:hypothetical protein
VCLKRWRYGSSFGKIIGLFTLITSNSADICSVTNYKTRPIKVAHNLTGLIRRNRVLQSAKGRAINTCFHFAVASSNIAMSLLWHTT